MIKRSAMTLLVGVMLGAGLAVPASIAAGKITGRDVKNGSLTGKDVKSESLSGKDVRDGSLTSQDFSQTFTWRTTVRSDSANISGQTIPAGSIVVPVRAELVSQFCGSSPVNNPQAATFQISMVDGFGESLLVNHPIVLQSQAAGASARHLAVALPGCGPEVASATLEFTFEVRAGGQGKAAAFG